MNDSPTAENGGGPSTPVPYSRLSISSKTPVHGRPKGEEAHYLLDEGTSAPSNWGTSKWNAQTSSEVTLEITVSGAPILLAKYALKSANDCPNRDPKTWSLSCERKTVIHAMTDNSCKWPSRWQWKEFPVEQQQPSNKFYLTINNNHGDGGCTQLGQLRLFSGGSPSLVASGAPPAQITVTGTSPHGGAYNDQWNLAGAANGRPQWARRGNPGGDKIHWDGQRWCLRYVQEEASA